MDVLRSESRAGGGNNRQLLVPEDASRIVEREIDVQSRPARIRREDPVVARRRLWFQRLLAVAVTTLVVAVWLGGWLWLPFVMSSALVGGYVAVLRHLKLQRDEARRVVRDLDLTSHEVPQHADAVVSGGAASPDSGTVRLRRWDE